MRLKMLLAICGVLGACSPRDGEDMFRGVDVRPNMHRASTVVECPIDMRPTARADYAALADCMERLRGGTALVAETAPPPGVQVEGLEGVDVRSLRECALMSPSVDLLACTGRKKE